MPTQVPAHTRLQLTESLEGDNIQFINRVQINCACCGVDSYRDWANTTWSRDNPGVLAPVSCCRNGIQDNCSMSLVGIYTDVSNALHRSSSASLHTSKSFQSHVMVSFTVAFTTMWGIPLVI